MRLGEGYGQKLDDILEMLHKYGKSKHAQEPFVVSQLAHLNVALTGQRVVPLKSAPMLIDVDCRRGNLGPGRNSKLRYYTIGISSNHHPFLLALTGSNKTKNTHHAHHLTTTIYMICRFSTSLGVLW